MSAFDDILASDAAIFTDPTLMPGVETITYTPSEGDEKTITAQVFRAVPVMTEMGPSKVVRIIVNRADVPVVTKNVDRVGVSLRVGETANEFVVSEIINQDAGAFELQLE